MQALNNLFGLIDVHVKNRRRLGIEDISSYVWTLILLLDILLIYYLTTSNVSCIPAVENASLLTTMNPPDNFRQYFESTCGTEIKVRSQNI